MSKSLGIYIENNLIKYAKVSKERDNTKVESYGVRTFENLNSEIKKVIEETYSYNTPISINISDEKYLYFDVFALLNKKDVQKTVETEFEAYCEEKKYNKDAFEMRYALVPNMDDKDKIKAIDVMVNKIELNRQIQPFESYRLAKILPLPVAIADISEADKKENVLIVNMEKNTTITTVIDQKIYDVKTLEIGSGDVLEKINKVENSYSKAYEACKNTTIYTADSEGLGDEQPYLQYIIPVVYKIREQLQEVILSNSIKFDKIYLSGTLAQVNNIDLYFQEVMQNGECTILKPKFLIGNNTLIDIKDYIEVNSAIALAINGVGEGNQALNFKKAKVGEKFSLMMKADSGKPSKTNEVIQKALGKLNMHVDLNMKGKLDYTEVWMVRIIVALIFITIIYFGFSMVLYNQMIAKENEIEKLKISQNEEISKINTNKQSLESKISKYKALVKRLEEENDKISEIAARKNSIPNLLNQIMEEIPDTVQVISIDNSLDKHIVIKVQSKEYDQLGIFIGVLKTKEILKDVVSSSGSKNGETITVTIEGELP